MNILIDALPYSIEINGVDYPINADFRTAIQIMLDFESDEWLPAEKHEMMVRQLYKEPYPKDFQEAVNHAIAFLNGNTEPDIDGGEEPMRLYSFEKDAGLIFAAFRQTHGIDLTKENLHWWEFITLFGNMGGDTAFSNLVSLRKRVKEGKATKEEIAVAREIGDAFNVDEPERITLEEQQRHDDFWEAWNYG